jgi:hypothetical protein
MVIGLVCLLTQTVTSSILYVDNTPITVNYMMYLH